jgi:hypothetical protein
MKPSLLLPTREPRHARRRRRGRGAPGSEPPREPAAQASTPSAKPSTPPVDLAVQRVRDAGGPVDQASYTCQCGYLFSATVSTTVMCPHCGTDQAW